MLQAFAAWNLSIDHQGEGSRGGRKIWRCLVKWEFYAVVTEELMSYVNIDEQKTASNKIQLHHYIGLEKFLLVSRERLKCA